MAADDTSYDLQVFYSVTRADDIDLVEEGVYAQGRYLDVIELNSCCAYERVRRGLMRWGAW